MRWKLALAVVVAAVICSSAPAADLAVLLEKGVYLEKTKGDLEGAIEAYKQIVKESEGDRRLLAEAYYRMGECYTRKGQRREATEAFEKVVGQFADQAALAQQARARLEVFNPANVPSYWKAPAVQVARTDKAPVIDGALNDAAWSRAPDTHELHHRKGIVSDIEMDSWTTYNDDGLYVAFRCPEENLAGMRLTAGKSEDPAVLCNDDCVQVALATDAARTSFYKFVVTGAGAVAGCKAPEKIRVTEFTHAVGKEAAAWTCEIFVPWKTLKMQPPIPGEKIGVQFTRTRNSPVKGQQMRVSFPIRANAAAMALWPDIFSGTLQFGTKTAGEGKKTVTVNGAISLSRIWVYELPEAEGRDEAVRYIGQMRDKFAPGEEIIDAARTDEAALREKLRGGFRLYTTLGEKSRLLRLATEGMGWELGAEQIRRKTLTAGAKNLRIILAGRNPWSDGPCAIYAAASNHLLVNINSLFHGPSSYHVFAGTDLVGEGSYEMP